MARLYFPVPAQAGAEGVLLRSFLRGCRLSTELGRSVKFTGGGFFADGRPVLANQRVWPGQVVSFALPEAWILDNYVTAFSRMNIGTAYKNSLIIGLESTAHYGDNLVRYLVAGNYKVCVEPHQDFYYA